MRGEKSSDVNSSTEPQPIPWDVNDIEEIQKTAAIMKKIAADERAFKAIVEAYDNEDAETFHAEISNLGLLDDCERICYWICFKRCVLRCKFFCPIEQSDKNQIQIDEMRKFAQEVPKLIQDKEMLNRLLIAYDKNDAKTFQEILKKHTLLPYCIQICSWFCHIRCRRVCIKMCPPSPRITHIGSIPTTGGHFKPSGFADGESEPSFLTPAVNLSVGRGDHPFGGGISIRGVFNMTNPDKYIVEYLPPGGSWTPIKGEVKDAYYDSGCMDAFGCPYKREPDGSGWYKIQRPPPPPLEIDQSLHGMGQVPGPPALLAEWNTLSPPVADGIYFLRLKVQKGANVRQSPTYKLVIDNTLPKVQQLELFLEEPSTPPTPPTIKPLECCGEVKKGQGIIQIHFKASDENFGYYSLTAKGGCSGPFHIIDIDTLAPVSRSYNGNTSDQGELVTKIVRWNPWSGPGPLNECCCYMVELRIYDRAIVGDTWGYRHYADPDIKSVSLRVCP
jgi:hypothetical protein